MIRAPKSGFRRVAGVVPLALVLTLLPARSRAARGDEGLAGPTLTFTVEPQTDATGFTLRVSAEGDCSPGRKRQAGRAGKQPCRQPLAGARIVVRDEGRELLFSGTATAGGALRRAWDDLPPEALAALLGGPSTVEMKGNWAPSRIDLSEARLQVARRLLARAWSRAADDDVAGAKEAARVANLLGVSTAETDAAISSAPSEARRHEEDARAKHDEEVRLQAERANHAERARAAIKRNDPDAARIELDELERLGGDVADLRRAADETPKARALAREAERNQRREEARLAAEERQRQAQARKVMHTVRARAARTRVPRLLLTILDGSIDRLQMALNASAASKAGIRLMYRMDADILLSALYAGERGVSAPARNMGLTAVQIRGYAELLFGPALFARFVPAAASGTPMATAVANLRATGSYEYMRGMAQKDFDDELSRLASAYSSSIGELGAYNQALAMFQIVVPFLLYPDAAR